MALTNIEYGSIANSKVLNDNFTYLEKKMDNYTTDLESVEGALTSAMNSQFETLSLGLKENTEELQADIDDLTESVTKNKEEVDDAIANVYNWITPDYTKGVTVSYPKADSRWKAPNYGVYVTFLRGNTNAQLYINNTASAYKLCTAYSEFIIPVAKDDELYWDKAVVSVTTSTFYPYKGCS